MPSITIYLLCAWQVTFRVEALFLTLPTFVENESNPLLECVVNGQSIGQTVPRFGTFFVVYDPPETFTVSCPLAGGVCEILLVLFNAELGETL